MALRFLEERVRTRLRSGVAITSIAQCVQELVENSIDAGATCVAVRLDVGRYKVQVVDNGKGITNDEMKIVGERYATSKCHSLADLDSLQYFGFRGEALASIVDVSGTVELTSRHRLSPQAYSKVFHKGRPTGGTTNSHRPSVGTTVTVHDFFHNLPVRRRSISELLELERVKTAVACIALVNPSRSFSIRNDKTGESILQTRKSHSILSNFGHIFGRDKAANMKEVGIAHHVFKLSGLISTEGHYNKSLQFIYVNGRVVRKTPLHACVNSVLSNSLICKKLSRVSENQQGSQQKEFMSPRCVSDKHGMYIITIECPRTEYDICLEPAKTLIEFQHWDDVLSAAELLARKFLEDNNLSLGISENKDPSEAPRTHKQLASSICCEATTTARTLPKLSGREGVFDLMEVCNAVYSRTVRNPARWRAAMEQTVDRNSEDVQTTTDQSATSSDSLNPTPMSLSDASRTGSCTHSSSCASSAPSSPGVCSLTDSQNSVPTPSCVRPQGDSEVKHHQVREMELVHISSTADDNPGSWPPFKTTSQSTADAGSATGSSVQISHHPTSQSFLTTWHNRQSLHQVTQKHAAACSMHEYSLNGAQDSLVLFPSTYQDPRRSFTHIGKHELVAQATTEPSVSRANTLRDLPRVCNQETTSAPSLTPLHSRLKDCRSEHQVSVRSAIRSPLHSSLTSKLANLFKKGQSSQQTTNPQHLKATTSQSTPLLTVGEAVRTPLSIGLGEPLQQSTPVPGTQGSGTGPTAAATHTNDWHFPPGKSNGFHLSSSLSKSGIPMHPNFQTRAPSNLLTDSYDSRGPWATLSVTWKPPSMKTCPEGRDKVDSWPAASNISSALYDSGISIASCSLVASDSWPAASNVSSALYDSGISTASCSLVASDSACWTGAHTDTALSDHPPTTTGLPLYATLSPTYPQPLASQPPASYGSSSDSTRAWSGSVDVSSQCRDDMGIPHSSCDSVPTRTINPHVTTSCGSQFPYRTHLQPLAMHNNCESSSASENVTDSREELTTPFSSISSVNNPSRSIKNSVGLQSSSIEDSGFHDCSSVTTSLSSRSSELELSGLSANSCSSIFTPEPTNHTCRGTVSMNVSKQNSVASAVKPKPLWKETTDPASGRKIYIHALSGLCSMEKPASLESEKELPTSFSTRGCDSGLDIQTETESSVEVPSHMNASTSLIQKCSSSFGAAPLRSAPHLSHDFSPLLPRPKRMRTIFSLDGSCNPNISLDSSSTSSTSTSVSSASLSLSVGSKWRDFKELAEVTRGWESSSVDRLLETWENPTFRPGHEDIVNIGHPAGRGNKVKVHRVIHSYKFSKEMFQNMKVLGQVDDKFIACLMDSQNSASPDLLVLIDQHAAHERVRLENLTAALYEEGAQLSCPRIKSSVVQPPIPLSLQSSERRLARLFRTQLQAVGVSLQFSGEGVVVTSLPSVLMEREASEVRRGRPTVALEILQELVVKQLELLQTTCGGSSTLPPTLTHILNSQACHGAIKFGDHLSLEECQSLVRQLSRCKLPFQCAHGRPSLMPILDLRILNRKFPPQTTAFPTLKNLGKAVSNSVC